MYCALSLLSLQGIRPRLSGKSKDSVLSVDCTWMTDMTDAALTINQLKMDDDKSLGLRERQGMTHEFIKMTNFQNNY